MIKFEVTELTQERLHAVLSYKPESGDFRWKVQLGNKAPVGRLAGSVGHHGYRTIRIDQRDYRAARLAFFWMTGGWPDSLIDHIDGDRAHDRWANLREATPQQNNANTKQRSDQRHAKGVSQVKKTGRWAASITIDKRKVHLGCFASPAEAAAAYQFAARNAFGQFARTM